MSNYPNYRVSVEIVLIHNNKVLLTKRSSKAKVAPNVWNVPAGKVKYLETPIEALYRESKEEINLNVRFIKELGVRAFKSDNEEEVIYRLVYTYLVDVEDKELLNLKLNDEHTEYRWVSGDDIKNKMFDTLDASLKNIILFSLNKRVSVKVIVNEDDEYVNMEGRENLFYS